VRRVPCVIALVTPGVLAALNPAASADPPDPTWLGGYWNDADFDAAIAFVTSASAISAPPVIEANPALAPAEQVDACDGVFPSLTLRALSCPRAPPGRLSPDN
jgi:hypothetical protein